MSRKSPSRTIEENLEAIRSWERAVQRRRTRAERFSDRVTRAAASGPAITVHLVWFIGWILVNTGAVRGIRVFDPFPFSFLTMVVSLEAIFLTLLVLASQNQMSSQSDKRAHLDLQIDLLAEREMTAVLQLLQDIATHLQVPVPAPNLMRDLMAKTDVESLERRIEDVAGEVQGGATKNVRDSGVE